METIISVVGFLGAGKTTLLKYLINKFTDNDWNPFIILNDYENANMDAQQLGQKIDFNNVKALSGSCICCSGIVELRNIVNRIPERENGITLIEANGTSDACTLMEFLGVGLKDRFLPPIQISVVDVKNWQKRGEHNELESNQIQISSLVILTHLKNTTKNRQSLVYKEVKEVNPMAQIINIDNLDISLLPKLLPSNNTIQKFKHQKSHWTSCSTDLPNLPSLDCIYTICKELPKSILRVKGCTKIKGDNNHTYFERTPDGKVHVRPFNGVPITGNKLLSIGAGSEPLALEKAIKFSLNENIKTLEHQNLLNT